MKLVGTTSRSVKKMEDIIKGFGLKLEDISFVRVPLDQPYELEGETVQRVKFEGHIRKDGQLCPLKIDNQPVAFITTVKAEKVINKAYLVNSCNSTFQFVTEPGDRIIMIK